MLKVCGRKKSLDLPLLGWVMIIDQTAFREAWNQKRDQQTRLIRIVFKSRNYLKSPLPEPCQKLDFKLLKVKVVLRYLHASRNSLVKINSRTSFITIQRLKLKEMSRYKIARWLQRWVWMISTLIAMIIWMKATSEREASKHIYRNCVAILSMPMTTWKHGMQFSPIDCRAHSWMPKSNQ